MHGLLATNKNFTVLDDQQEAIKCQIVQHVWPARSGLRIKSTSVYIENVNEQQHCKARGSRTASMSQAIPLFW